MHLEVGQAGGIDHGRRAAQAAHDVGAGGEQPLPDHLLRDVAGAVPPLLAVPRP